MANSTNPWNVFAKRYKNNRAAKAILIIVLTFIAIALMVYLSTCS